MTASSDNGTAAVSVVVPCYRCAGTIDRAVRSVAAQTRRPAELILVDDASGDGTGAMLEELRQRYGAQWIRILTLERNQGPATARNAGWDAATSKYVAFLDADDAWHPRKIEIQCDWMDAHPEVAVSGHASRQLAAETGANADPEAGEAKPVSRAALFVSNPFITPSVMLRREIAQRFESGKRHMEDYLLWLELASSGQRIARLPQVLAYTFKAPIGESGLSGQAWNMEKGELATFRALLRAGSVGPTLWLLLSVFSLAKFSRRLLMLAVGYSPRGESPHPQYLFPAAYAVLTQAMTALLVGAGLLGQSELAADVGVVQAATLATFFAFSGNARNLILSTQATVPLAAILGARFALLLPLCGAALLLSVAVARVDIALALVLVGRRAAEWIGELELSDSELRGDRRVALRSLVLQSILLGVALLALAFAPAYAYWAILAWALMPMVPALRFAVPVLLKARAVLGIPLRTLLPHFGSTAATGVSLYAFRALLVLVAGRAVAGDLFTAFAVGSVIGTIFANVLGPSFALHEERSGRTYLPKLLWLVILFYLAASVLLLTVGYVAPGVFEATHKTPFFWRALGWSLLGGVMMVAAQRSRLRLLAQGRGDRVFGPDVMIHVLLISAVPVLYATDRSGGWVALYAWNAFLALVFYAAGVSAEARSSSRGQDRLAPALAFCVFFPLFFLLSGAIYNSPYPWIDSGGVLAQLPLPISVLACFGGLLLLGRYGRAAPALWTILGMLVLMLLSSAMVAGSETAERSKMLLMLQMILPTFGLVLGVAIDPEGSRLQRIEFAILAAVALIVPVQLGLSWFGGSFALTHDLRFMSVYQHYEYVPVILICGFLIALPGAWARAAGGWKAALAGLFALLAAYAASVYSMTSMALIVAALAAFAFLRVVIRREVAATAAALAVLASLAGYNFLIRDTDAFHNKFSFLFPADDGWAHSAVSENGEGTRRHFAGWRIDADRPGRVLLRIAKYNRAARATLVVEGELVRGELALKTEDASGRVSPDLVRSALPGAFRFAVEVDTSASGGDVLLEQGIAPTRAVVRRMHWMPSPQAAAPAPAAAGPQNISERITDWRLFGTGILDSPQAFLFGHEKAMARDVRSSAHNYYLDFIYNFGALALVPLLSLIVFTAAQLWRHRRALLASESLLAHAAVVLFLVLIESNVKVSLRQPYSGIAIFFLWGLLLARLREPAGAAARTG